MLIFLILAFIVAVIAVFFAVQNAVPVSVALFTFTFNSSLALILLVTFGLGMLTGFLGLAPGIIKRRKQLYDRNREIKALEKTMAETPEEPEKALPPSAESGTQVT